MAVKSHPSRFVRQHLLTDCDLHTILRLPTGIFYAQGVKANVILFDKIPSNGEGDLWVYDLRTDKKFSLRTNPLARTDLADFVSCCAGVSGKHLRREKGSDPRWRKFSRQDLLRRDGCRLDINWRATQTPSERNVQDVASEIVDDLYAALSEMQRIRKLLGE